MIRTLFFTTICLLSISAFAQKAPLSAYAAVDKKALQMPDSCANSTLSMARYITANFQTEDERVRAAFIWVASNLQYDLSNMFAINFHEQRDEKVTKALTTRKAICEGYAALFSELCNRMGIKSFVVEGYTKQNGFTDYIPHAWCAVRTNNTWLLYDPTWGSGYVSNGKFVRKVNNTYFAVKPNVLIKSHMPFDYLWQFLNYPVTNQEFYEGKTAENKSKPYFSYADSIAAYEGLKHTEQLTASARRVEAAGVKNAMVFDRLRHIKEEIEHERQSNMVGSYNGAVADYNEGLGYYNDFINYRNKQFTPSRPDAEIQAMLDDAAKRFSSAKAKVASSIESPDPANAASILQLTRAIDEAESHLHEMQDWLTKYFSKGKAGRKSMFYKVTWFGVPLN